LKQLGEVVRFENVLAKFLRIIKLRRPRVKNSN
jgi:hypothetical protein